MYIDVKDVSVSFAGAGGATPQLVLDRVSLEVARGEFLCLLGASGCGKSTLLSVMAGFLRPASGVVTVEGKPVMAPSISRVTIFQNYGLLPWRTVGRNVELGLESLRVPRERRREVARHFVKLVGLADSMDKYPWQLSGGMQQRVAIARALAVQPDVLFMDEPFGALDAITRMQLQDDVSRLVREVRTTVLFVTHDIEEAVFLADRIVVMAARPGRIQTVLPVAMPRHRDRTSAEFLQVRDRVYQALHMKEEDRTEFYI